MFKNLESKANQLFIKSNQLLMKKSKGEQNMLIVLGLCVVGTFLLITFKNGASDMVTSLTSSVNSKITAIFSGI
jgi:hypothetical protein